MWVLWWMTSTDFWMKPLPQSEHLKVVLARWTLRCIFLWAIKSEFCAKPSPQSVHTNGFPPVWTLMCSRRVALRVKRLWHSEQGKGFSPVCILWWRIRLDFRVKHLLHWLQGNNLSPLYAVSGLVASPLSENHSSGLEGSSGESSGSSLSFRSQSGREIKQR